MLVGDAKNLPREERREWLDGLPTEFKTRVGAQLTAYKKAEDARLVEQKALQEKTRQQAQQQEETRKVDAGFRSISRHNDYMRDHRANTDRIYRMNGDKIELVEVPWSMQRVGRWSDGSAPAQAAQWVTAQGAGFASVLMDVAGIQHTVGSDKWERWAENIGSHDEKQYHGGKKVTGEGTTLASGEDALWLLLREEFKARHEGKTSITMNPAHDPYFSGDRFRSPYGGHYQYGRITGIREFINGDQKALPENLRSAANKLLKELQEEGYLIKNHYTNTLQYNPDYSPEMLVDNAATYYERNKKK